MYTNDTFGFRQDVESHKLSHICRKSVYILLIEIISALWSSLLNVTLITSFSLKVCVLMFSVGTIAVVLSCGKNKAAYLGILAENLIVQH